MASLPFRTQGFQKDNLSCVITSICDLGQALVMHECLYRRALDLHAAHWTTVPEEIQSSLLWTLAALLLLAFTAADGGPEATTRSSRQLGMHWPRWCPNWYTIAEGHVKCISAPVHKQHSKRQREASRAGSRKTVVSACVKEQCGSC